MNQESVPVSILSQFKILKNRLLEWKREFLTFECMYKATLSTRDRQHASLLHIHHSTATILLCGEISPHEMIYDTFDEEFQSIVQRSEELLQNGLAHTCENTFSMELGVVQPLYITSIKCRVPHIRFAAISLLATKPRLEGIWNGQVMSKIAEQVRLIEETDYDVVPRYPSRLPEYRRIHSVGADINPKARTAQFFCSLRQCGESGKFEQRNGTVTW